MRAVVGENVIAAEVAGGEQLVGAAQDSLGGVLGCHETGKLRLKMNVIGHSVEPQGH